MCSLACIAVDLGQRYVLENRKDYAFRRQVNEKPIIVPGCALRCVLLYLVGLLSGQLLFASDPGQPF